MRIIARKTLRQFERQHPTAAPALRRWEVQVKAARWLSPSDLASWRLFSPDPVGSDRAVFDILGNRFRLVCRLDYDCGLVFVLWFGTHAEYDRIDVHAVTYSGGGS